jgi:hypothetical protein
MTSSGGDGSGGDDSGGDGLSTIFVEMLTNCGFGVIIADR